MKLFCASVLSLALSGVADAALAIQLDSAALQPACAYPIGTGGSANAKPAGRVFNIDDKVEYFAGSNAWWLAHLSKNSDVDTALQEVANTQYKILRVWGFGDVNTVPDPSATDPNKIYFQVLNSTGSYINYGADGLQRLDYVVSATGKYGVKLVLNFVNNWSDYGGIAAYTTAFGANATQWFTDTTSQQVYKNYIKATGISQYIKSLDAGHMVTLGDEGWFAPADNIGDGSYAYGGEEGVDFVSNLKLPTLDYGVFHLYPDSWGYNYTWGTTWIEEHDTVGQSIGKPVILEEYGTPFPHNHTGTEAPWQAAVVASGLVADQIWQFGTPDLSVPAGNLGDVNTIYYNDTEYKTLAREHAAAMLAKHV